MDAGSNIGVVHSLEPFQESCRPERTRRGGAKCGSAVMPPAIPTSPPVVTQHEDAKEKEIALLARVAMLRERLLAKKRSEAAQSLTGAVAAAGTDQVSPPHPAALQPEFKDSMPRAVSAAVGSTLPSCGNAPAAPRWSTMAAATTTQGAPVGLPHGGEAVKVSEEQQTFAEPPPPPPFAEIAGAAVRSGQPTSVSAEGQHRPTQVLGGVSAVKSVDEFLAEDANRRALRTLAEDLARKRGLSLNKEAMCKACIFEKARPGDDHMLEHICEDDDKPEESRSKNAGSLQTALDAQPDRYEHECRPLMTNVEFVREDTKERKRRKQGSKELSKECKQDAGKLSKREAKEANKDIKDAKDAKATKEARDVREVKEARDAKEKEVKDAKCTKDAKDVKQRKDLRKMRKDKKRGKDSKRTRQGDSVRDIDRRQKRESEKKAAERKFTERKVVDEDSLVDGRPKASERKSTEDRKTTTSKMTRKESKKSEGKHLPKRSRSQTRSRSKRSAKRRDRSRWRSFSRGTRARSRVRGKVQSRSKSRDRSRKGRRTGSRARSRSRRRMRSRSRSQGCSCHRSASRAKKVAPNGEADMQQDPSQELRLQQERRAAAAASVAAAAAEAAAAERAQQG